MVSAGWETYPGKRWTWETETFNQIYVYKPSPCSNLKKGTFNFNLHCQWPNQMILNSQAQNLMPVCWPGDKDLICRVGKGCNSVQAKKVVSQPILPYNGDINALTCPSRYLQCRPHFTVQVSWYLAPCSCLVCEVYNGQCRGWNEFFDPALALSPAGILPPRPLNNHPQLRTFLHWVLLALQGHLLLFKQINEMDQSSFSP